MATNAPTELIGEDGPRTLFERMLEDIVRLYKLVWREETST